MKLSINENTIFTFLFFTLFLDAYCFFAIGNRSITPWYIGAGLLIFWALFRPAGMIAGIHDNPYALMMLGYMIVNYYMYGNGETASLAIGLLCWLFYICSYRKCEIHQFEKTVRFFQKGMNLLALYGIYQIIAYALRLPFADPSISGFMVEGYNWGNNISIGSLVLRRSNAIFREPSYFSQFLAINILIYFKKMISNKNNKYVSDTKILKWIIVDGIALICTFSGTGLMMLGFGGVILLLLNNSRDTIKFFKRHLMIVFLVIAVIVIPNPLTSYLLSRTREFDYTNIHSVSGYLRLILPYQVAIEIVTGANALFGVGIGNIAAYTLRSTRMAVGNNVATIVARTLAEEGLIGGILLLGFTKRTWKSQNFISGSYQAILIGIYLMAFMHGTWSSEVFWLLLGFLNCKFVKDTAMPEKAEVV